MKTRQTTVWAMVMTASILLAFVPVSRRVRAQLLAARAKERAAPTLLSESDHVWQPRAPSQAALAPTTGVTSRVSVASDGTQADLGSQRSAISADGRYVAFGSFARNLVDGDTKRMCDVFVHDRQTGQTERVSVASDGAEPDDDSDEASISADGRYVAFWSEAMNLMDVNENGFGDIFVHDRQTGQTERVSIASDGSEGDGRSVEPSISADGRYVAFQSKAANLVPGATNDLDDVFVHDRQTGQTEQVSVDTDGAPGNGNSLDPSISANGRYVAFWSLATNLVPNDTNGARDVFVHDRESGRTERVSIASDGAQANDNSIGNPSLSANGRYVAFRSLATNLVPGDTNGAWQIFVHDRQTGQTEMASIASDGSPGDDSSDEPSISADGRYVAFQSLATNLVPGPTSGLYDVFVHDLETGETRHVSVASDGAAGNDYSDEPSISADGRYVAFKSFATNLVSGDSNGTSDIFVHELEGVSAAACFVPFFWQRDPQWSEYGLGTFGQCDPEKCDTVGECGCALTLAAMTFNAYGADLTPGLLSECLGTGACPLDWEVGAQCSDGTAIWRSENEVAFSWERLHEEVTAHHRPVLLGMYRRDDLRNTHWVLVHGYIGENGSLEEIEDAGNYLVHDPALKCGANQLLSTRSEKFAFHRIVVYEKPWSCPSLFGVEPACVQIGAHPEPALPSTWKASISGASIDSGLQSAAPPAVTSGMVWAYRMTPITMTVELTATSSAGDVTEMLIWSDTISNTVWRSFAQFVWLPVSDHVYFRFRDDQGNVSSVYSDSSYPGAGPPFPLWEIFLPAVLKE